MTIEDVKVILDQVSMEMMNYKVLSQKAADARSDAMCYKKMGLLLASDESLQDAQRAEESALKAQEEIFRMQEELHNFFTSHTPSAHTSNEVATDIAAMFK